MSFHSDDDPYSSSGGDDFGYGGYGKDDDIIQYSGREEVGGVLFVVWCHYCAQLKKQNFIITLEQHLFWRL